MLCNRHALKFSQSRPHLLPRAPRVRRQALIGRRLVVDSPEQLPRTLQHGLKDLGTGPRGVQLLGLSEGVGELLPGM